VQSNSVQHRQVALDKLNQDAVILDQHGHAWQNGGIYWYRAFDSDRHESSFNLAQFAGDFKVIHGGQAGD
jgi:hypothetical protein